MFSAISSALSQTVNLPLVAAPVTANSLLEFGLITVAAVNGFRQSFNVKQYEGPRKYDSYIWAVLSLGAQAGAIASKDADIKLLFNAITVVCLIASYTAEQSTAKKVFTPVQPQNFDPRKQVEWTQPAPKESRAEVHHTPEFIALDPKKATFVEAKPTVAPAVPRVEQVEPPKEQPNKVQEAGKIVLESLTNMVKSV